jgi:enamine deaminase RidA (YjgF/YER057c/UK114 family)
MADFINPTRGMISDYVVYRGRVLETVIVPIPDGADKPVPGGPAAEAREIFRQLDEVLRAAGVDRTAVVSVKLFLQHVNCDIATVNEVYRDYFRGHAPMRFAIGADLQAGMLIEAAFTAELPDT